jgi:hypothetical protein
MNPITPEAITGFTQGRAQFRDARDKAGMLARNRAPHFAKLERLLHGAPA